MERRTRRFNLGDLMILILALGMAMVSLRTLWLGYIQGPGVVDSWQWTYHRLLWATLLTSCATPMSLACLAFRVRQPRPAWRRVALQPGTAAMIACVVSFAARLLELTGSLVVPDLYRPLGITDFGRSSPIRFGESMELVLMRTLDRGGVIGSIEPFACHTTLVAAFAWPCGIAVASVWLVLALSGRWRPEKSWIDRLGRALGVTWLVVEGLVVLPL